MAIESLSYGSRVRRPQPAQAGMAGQSDLDLSVIIPTRNEAGNVELLLTRIENAFTGPSSAGASVEVIFVDDSSDETPQVVTAAAQRFPKLNVRLIHRPPEQRADGLGGAVVMGLASALSPYACVMDGDLQHPPELVPILLRTARERRVDLVVATRRNVRSQVTGLNLPRNLVSRGLDILARVLFPKALSNVTDPLTGFFLVRVKALALQALRPRGFKILLEILVRNPNLRKEEIPFRFGPRFSGHSKASAAEAWKYLTLLWNLRFNGGFTRFLGFAAVGASGIVINSLALYIATERLHVYYLVSAALATVASTLWNFALTELWIYRSAPEVVGRLRRLALFFVVNVLALSLRAPVIYALTSLAGVHYVISNLLSLALLTVLRFELADNIIWKPAPSTDNALSRAGSVNMKRTFSYNIHDIVTVESDAVLPELEPFQVESDIVEPTIRVRIGIPQRKKADDQHYIHYAELLGHLGFEVGIQLGEQVDIVASPMLQFSPHVLYTNIVEPVLRWTFVRKGYALVHGATLAFGDQACMVTARTDTGKTTTLLKILAYQRRSVDSAAFLSDDMTIVSPDGTALTYPKPLTISFHTLHAINTNTLSRRERLTLPLQSRIHSRTGRRFAFTISKSRLPAATINMLLQMVVPPPKYFVDRLLPNVKLARHAKLMQTFIIERASEEESLPLDSGEALDVLLQNCEDAYGFPPYDALKEFLYKQDGVDLRLQEQAIIRQALGQLPATVVRSSAYAWWSRIPTFMNNDQVSHDMARALEFESTGRKGYDRRGEVVTV